MAPQIGPLAQSFNPTHIKKRPSTLVPKFNLKKKKKKKKPDHQNEMWIFLSGAKRFISNLWSRRGKNLVGPKWLCWYEYHKPKVVKPSNPRQKSMAKPQTWPQALSYLVLVTLLSLSLFFLPILPTLNQPLSQSHSHTFRLRFWTLTWNFLWSVKKKYEFIYC